MNGFLITGTDTGVGKTIVSLGISLVLKDMGVKSSYMKPIESGVNSDNEGDAYLIKTMLKLTESINKIRPFRLANPLAPELAFKIENKTLNMRTIVRNYHLLTQKNNLVIVEGAGGIMTPIGNNIFFGDIAKLLNIPIIIVIANKLGAINHSLLTIHYALTMKLNIACCILNSVNNKKDIAENTNYSQLLTSIDFITKQNKTRQIPLFQTSFVKDIKNKDDYKENFMGVTNYIKGLIVANHFK